MTRKEEIARASKDYHLKRHPNFTFGEYVSFIDGAEWADAHPDIDVRTMAAWQSGYNEGIAKSRWISVEDEELPKPGEMVLAFKPDDTFQFTTTFFTTIDMWNKLGITHWMRLSLPPIITTSKKGD